VDCYVIKAERLGRAYTLAYYAHLKVKEKNCVVDKPWLVVIQKNIQP